MKKHTYFLLLLTLFLWACNSTPKVENPIEKWRADSLIYQMRVPSVSVNGSNIIYIGEDNQLDIDKGNISMAVLIAVPFGCGSSTQGSGLTRIIRATKPGKVVFWISGGKSHEPRQFTLYAKYRDKK